MNELAKTKSWFEQAIPNPTQEQACIQIGCHLEEVSEMTFELYDSYETAIIEHLANNYKQSLNCDTDKIKTVDREALFDAVVDQIVTAVGVCHMMGFDVEAGLAEVNRSNFSKFEDGKPVFNEHGKISKGKNYTPPKLDKFIKGDNR